MNISPKDPIDTVVDNIKTLSLVEARAMKQTNTVLLQQMERELEIYRRITVACDDRIRELE